MSNQPNFLMILSTGVNLSLECAERAVKSARWTNILSTEKIPCKIRKATTPHVILQSKTDVKYITFYTKKLYIV